MRLKGEWAMDADFVVVGTGIGGVTAAIVAADAGLDVVLVERADKVGGVSGVSGGLVWMPLTRYAEGQGDSAEAVDTYLEAVAAGYSDPELRRRYLDAGPEAVHYLADHAGVRWVRAEGHVDNFYGFAEGAWHSRALDVEPFEAVELGEWRERTLRSQFFGGGVNMNEVRAWGGLGSVPNWDFGLMADRMGRDARTWGEGVMGYLLKAALIDRGIPVLLETRVDALLTDGDAVVGVVADGPNGRVEIRGRAGVLLATGGYDWNTTNTIESVPAFGSSCPPFVTGDHLVMAGEVGAHTITLPPVGLHTEFGFHVPGEEYEGAPLWRWLLVEAAQAHSIMVNDQGRRFCDESFFYNQQARLREFDTERRRYTNLPAYLIFDQDHRESVQFGPFPPGADLPEPPFVKADSLPELAAKLGIDAAGLTETVERFNGFCAAGADDDFGRGSKPFVSFVFLSPEGRNSMLGPVARGPFYGLQMQIGGLGANATGLHIDRNAQVQHVRGRPIPGLYAAGNAAAHTDLGPTYLSGGLMSRGLLWGYVAAQHAAATLKSSATLAESGAR